MKLSKFKFDLPEKLIAQYPAENRESSKLMVLDRKAHTIEHKVFSDLWQFLGDGDVMVFPKGVLIAIADTSDMVTFKLTASRKTVCSWPFGRISPSLATAAETVEALNEIL